VTKSPGPNLVPLQDPYSHREYLWRRWSGLKKERASWDSHAKELAQFLLPRASRFTTSETNQGGKRHNAIYDNTALKAVRTLGAGMMSGLTSPARPWFRLKHADDDLMEYEPVKVWCSQVTKMMRDVFGKSNIYRSLHQGYLELGVFGTHANLIMPHPTTLLHATPLTWGEYAIATDEYGMVNTLYREFKMTAVNMVRQFGYEACSLAVQNSYNRGHFDEWFDVVHALEPRLERDPRKLDPTNMAWSSCYFQPDGPKEKKLRESGMRRFRALAPRWQTTGQDVYGESPGMEALGDSRQLQHEQFRKAQGIDYMTRPPIGLPSSMKGVEVDSLPNGVTFFDSTQTTTGQRQLFDVKLDLNHLLLDIQDVRGRINAAFYADLFLMISSLDASGEKMTATEVAERHEEKLIMLGPVVERLHNEQIDPLIDMTFDMLMDNGLLPPPPPELEGEPLETELLGLLAQALKAVQTASVDRWLVGVGAVAGLGKPEVADKVNGDAVIEGYADALGIDPKYLNDDTTVERIRKQRQQAQQAAAAEAAEAAQAETASKLGKVPTAGGASNLAVDTLSLDPNGVDPIGMFSGYGSPQAERLN